MDEQRKYAILFAATILAARRLHEIGAKPCPARECAMAKAIGKCKHILELIEERWPTAFSPHARPVAGGECVWMIVTQAKYGRRP